MAGWVYPREGRVAGHHKLLGLPEHIVLVALSPFGVRRRKGAVECRDESQVGWSNR